MPWKRRFLSSALALALTVIAGSIAAAIGLPAPAYADTLDYPETDAADCSATYGIYSWCKGNPSYWMSSRGYAYRNCTDYVAWKLGQLGVASNKYMGLGHGGQWYEKAPGKELPRGTAPAVGAAAVKPATYDQNGAITDFGHVAYVTAVTYKTDGTVDTISVEEYNRAGTGVGSTWSGAPSTRGFTQYVYFGSLMTNPPGTPPTGADSDGDGIQDSQDYCPTYPGSSANNGCPTYVVTRQGGTMQGKMLLNDAWTTLTQYAADIQSAGNRFAYLDANHTLYAKDGINGTWYTEASNVDQYVLTADYLVIRQGGTVRGKATLTSSWLTLATTGAADIQSAGYRVAYRDTYGTVYAKDGLEGTWYAEATNVDQYVVSVGYLMVRQGGTVLAKGNLAAAWTQLSTSAIDIQTAGARFALLDAYRTLYAKDTLNGTWYTLATNVDQYVVTPAYVAVRNGGMMRTKAGLNDGWLTLTQYAIDIQAAGNRFAYLDANHTLYAKDGINGTWYTEASNVDQYKVTG